MASSCVIKVKNEARLRRQRLQREVPGRAISWIIRNSVNPPLQPFFLNHETPGLLPNEEGTVHPAATAKCEERQKKDDEQTKQQTGPFQAKLYGLTTIRTR
jgi:hypothetical protein